MATITNMAGRSLKDGQKVSAEDFYGTGSTGVQSAEAQIALLRGMSNGS